MTDFACEWAPASKLPFGDATTVEEEVPASIREEAPTPGNLSSMMSIMNLIIPQEMMENVNVLHTNEAIARWTQERKDDGKEAMYGKPCPPVTSTEM